MYFTYGVWFHSICCYTFHYRAINTLFVIISQPRKKAPPFLTSALDEGEWSASRPCRFNPRERAPSTHWIGGWVNPRAGLDAVE
jgi:hypothetical protein